MLAIVVAASLVAATWDLKTRRVPNVLTLSLMAFAVVAQMVIGGWAAGLGSLSIVAAVVVAGSLAHARGLIGGGDVKLFAGAAAALGWPGAFALALYTGIAGGLFAAIWAARERRLVTALGTAAYRLMLPGTHLSSTAGGARFPYSLAIAAGAIAVMLADTALPALRLPI